MEEQNPWVIRLRDFLNKLQFVFRTNLTFAAVSFKIYFGTNSLKMFYKMPILRARHFNHISLDHQNKKPKNHIIYDNFNEKIVEC